MVVVGGRRQDLAVVSGLGGIDEHGHLIFLYAGSFLRSKGHDSPLGLGGDHDLDSFKVPKGIRNFLLIAAGCNA